MNHRARSPLSCTALALAAALGAAGVASGQAAVRDVCIGAGPALARTLAAAGGALPGEAPASGRALAMHVLGSLRLAQPERAAAALAAAVHGTADDVPWLAAAWCWHTRATGAPALDPVRLTALQDAVVAAAAAPATGFVDAALQVHALLCCGELADALEPAAPQRGARTRPAARAGDAWRTRAIDRQLDLERRAWEPGLGCFRDEFVADQLAAPRPPQTATLLPASAGLLLATNERMHLHLTRVLADGAPASLRAPCSTPDRAIAGVSPDAATRPGGAAASGPGAAPTNDAATAAALRLIAATQLGDDVARAREWRRLLAACEGRVAAPDAGLVLDALLFAASGARVATGTGLDEAWQRFAPWLPPDHAALALPDVRVGGARWALRLERRNGPARADEVDTTAHLGGAGPRLHVQIDLLDAVRPELHTVIVASAGAQTVHALAPGETFVCSLPLVQTESQEETHALGGR